VVQKPKKNFLFSYTVYLIKVCITYPKEFAKCWTVSRSYSDFKSLDSKIRTTINDLPEDYPDLVSMKWFGSLEPEYVAFLLYQLREYLSKLMSIPCVYNHILMLTFFKEEI